MLNAVEPRSLAIQCDRAVLKARETLVETRTKLINSVRGTVKSFGGRLPASSSEAFVKKAGPRVPDELRAALEPLLELIQQVSVEIRRYDKQIEKLAEEKYPATQRIRSIRGVGPITSLAFVLNLDNDPQHYGAVETPGPGWGCGPNAATRASAHRS